MTPKARHFKIKDKERFQKEVMKFISDIHHEIVILTFKQSFEDWKARQPK